MARPTKNYQQVLRSYPRAERVNKLSIGAEMLYLRLLVLADCEGRFPASPKRLMGLALAERYANDTVEPADCARWLQEMQTVGLIQLYDVDGEPHLELQNYFRSQNNRVESQWPGPPGTGPAPSRPHSGDTDVPPVSPGGGHGFSAMKMNGDSTDTDTDTETETETETHARGDTRGGELSTSIPDWLPGGQLASWLQELQTVAFNLGRISKARRDVVDRGIIQAIVQVVPHPPDSKAPAKVKAWQSDLRAAPVVVEIAKWLRQLDAGAKGKPGKWLLQGLRGGPSPDRYLEPGWGEDATYAATGRAS